MTRRESGKRCAEAKTPRCKCWCAGAAHGKAHQAPPAELPFPNPPGEAVAVGTEPAGGAPGGPAPAAPAERSGGVEGAPGAGDRRR